MCLKAVFLTLMLHKNKLLFNVENGSELMAKHFYRPNHLEFCLLGHIFIRFTYVHFIN